MPVYRPLRPSLAAAPPSAALGSGALGTLRRAGAAEPTAADGADVADGLLEGEEEPGCAPRRQLAQAAGVREAPIRKMRSEGIESAKGRREADEGKEVSQRGSGGVTVRRESAACEDVERAEEKEDVSEA